MRSHLFSLALALIVGTGNAHADEDSHDRALRAVGRGEILPLSVILDRLHTSDQGQVLGVELEDEGGRWVYEVRTLSADGTIREHVLDAATGQPLPDERNED
ncbi:MAG: peptidase [Geminicoccaceae bacterium]